MNDVLTGLLIFKSYLQDRDSEFYAEYQEIFAGSIDTFENATDEEREELESAGWLWNDEFKCYSKYV